MLGCLASVKWRKRGYGRANLIRAGGEVLSFDDGGVLALAEPQSDSLRIVAKNQVFDSQTWTVPTLAGSRLYLRDRTEIVALDLSN